MRQPLLSAIGQARGARKAQSVFIPAPFKGLSSQQPRWTGDPGYASTFTNFWVNQGAVAVRPGSTTFANRAALGANLVGIAANPSAGYIYGLAAGGVYDVTAGGAYGAALYAVAIGGIVCNVNFTNSAGTVYSYFTNQSSAPFYMNGGAGAAPVITGVAAATLRSVWMFKRRLFFAEGGTGNAWYLPVDSIQGTAKKFPVGPLFPRGGYLLGGFSWSLDSGTGPDDYCGFVSSEGEIAVYAGTDPASSASFGLIGVFYVGKSWSPNCWCKVGGDVWIATVTGLYSMTQIAKSGKDPTPSEAISSSIANTWLSTWGAFPSGPAAMFQLLYYPEQNVAIVNIPNAAGTSTTQFVYNLLNNSWSAFNSWNIVQMVTYSGSLYAAAAEGNLGYVTKLWTGSSDWSSVGGNGQTIPATMLQVGYRAAGGRDFTIQVARPIFGLTTSSGSQQFCGTELNASNLFPWVQPSITNTLNQRHTIFQPDVVLACTVTQTYQGCELLFTPVTSP